VRFRRDKFKDRSWIFEILFESSQREKKSVLFKRALTNKYDQELVKKLDNKERLFVRTFIFLFLLIGQMFMELLVCIFLFSSYCSFKGLITQAF